MNTHGTPDIMVELDGTLGDFFPACVVSTTPPTVPASGLTLSSFATRAYVRAGTYLTYVDQPAVTVSIVGGDGTYWLAVTDDTFSAFSGWTRRAGSHYVWRASATRPSDVDNLLTFAQLTVSGGNITVVTPLLSAPLSQQLAGAVAITGGSATFSGLLQANGGITATNFAGGSGTFSGTLTAGSTTINGALDVVSTSRFQGAVGIGVVPNPSFCLVTNPGNAIFGGNVGVQGINPTTAGLTASTCLITTINCNGTASKPGGGPWSDASSALLKKNIRSIDNALELLLAQCGRVFEWRETERAALLPGERYGLIAEEVTLPQWQHPQADGLIAIAAQGFEALCIEALRTLVGMIEGIKHRLDALETV